MQKKKSECRKSLVLSIFLPVLAVCVFSIVISVVAACLMGSDNLSNFLYRLLNCYPALIIAIAAAVLIFFIIKNKIMSAEKQLEMLDADDPNAAQVYPEFRNHINNLSMIKNRYDSKVEALNKEHEKQDMMRREFTANVSHELKTPLTSISGYAEIIKNGIAREEDIPRFAGKICDESQRLITLVGDIIKLSQLDDKEIDVKTEDIDLYELCEAVIGHLELAAKRNDVTVSLKGEHLIIHSAEQLVEEMIFNICDNAIKYNKRGGSVSVSLKQCVDGVELSVKDTGIGIAKEDLPRIFERFYRVDKSHSREIGGTGLGLSIVKHGAMFVGATVTVDSTLGKGTAVRVLF